MKKQQAIQLLGGTVSSAARKVGISYQAVDRWPDVLTPAIRDRVQAALYRELMSRKHNSRKPSHPVAVGVLA